MKFGKVDNVEGIDFQLPKDHFNSTIHRLTPNELFNQNCYVGCAKWAKAYLKNFYPKGTKDELSYYSTQYNSIELNASFYRIFPEEQFAKWRDKTPTNFKFFPKVYQGLSHWKRLQDCERYIEEFTTAVSQLGEQLEMCFLQMPENFAPTQDNIDRLKPFLQLWPTTIPLAIELRHKDWFANDVVADFVFQLFEQYNITSVLTDTAGRRDLLHMRLTTSKAFIRFTGANDATDYSRAKEWVLRLKEWQDKGLTHLYFFIHQHTAEELLNLSSYFIQELNKQLQVRLNIPNQPQANNQANLFSV